MKRCTEGTNVGNMLGGGNTLGDKQENRKELSNASTESRQFEFDGEAVPTESVASKSDLRRGGNQTNKTRISVGGADEGMLRHF